ncbi:MAG: hypothetical protein EOO61_01425 [Hymenobacter sp.]|nr:MAG: hypothetical protein EOO61_01425 [Hymenobacter sp.]
MNKREAVTKALEIYFPELDANKLAEVLGKPNYNLIELGYNNSATASKATRKLFPNKAKSIKICTYLLDLDGLKYCNTCKEVKSQQEFSKKDDRLKASCKACDSSYQREYQKTHVLEQRARSAKRRAIETRAIPKWANMSAIRQVYLNCPAGYHVDHYYPLQGENVCGLHVVENLQYLTEFENLSKGNR